MQVVIVGGSLAGLMNAIVLQDLGHDVYVLEKSSEDSLRSQAAGLSAGPDVQRLIKEYMKPTKEYAKIATAVEVVDLEGNVINPIPSKDPYHLTTWSLLYNLFKSHLLAPGSTKPAARYETGKTVSAVEPEGDALVVSFTGSGTQDVHKLRADLVIAADGAHSTIRASIFPDVTPRYAGFITWRGAVPASEISPASRKAMEGRLLIFRTEDGYTLSYHVPAENGSMELEDSQFIWVWYNKLGEDTAEFNQTFTDSSGRRHYTTVPRGKVNPEAWADRQSRGTAISIPFAEMIAKTTDPFVSAIRDSSAPQCVARDGKLLLTGDAFTLFRPHTGSSTNQAARQALELAEVLKGEKSLEDWQTSSIGYARMTGAISQAFGEYCFTGVIPQSLSAETRPEQSK
ncbi:hypothetical protein GQ44DRAFT_657800 [Phaeosphaeriaceae sp. PMI808]|nr:hypothetical protein GQ44DRAFT_657800 [Phaeosphaeriaceae sp. PMI808]